MLGMQLNKQKNNSLTICTHFANIAAIQISMQLPRLQIHQNALVYDNSGHMVRIVQIIADGIENMLDNGHVFVSVQLMNIGQRSNVYVVSIERCTLAAHFASSSGQHRIFLSPNQSRLIDFRLLMSGTFANTPGNRERNECEGKHFCLPSILSVRSRF